MNNNICGFQGQQNWSPYTNVPHIRWNTTTATKYVTSQEYVAAKRKRRENKESITSKKHTLKKKKANQKRSNKQHKSTEYYRTKTTRHQTEN